MSFVCQTIDQATNICTQWVEQVSLIDQLAITQAQMVMLGTPIIGIYGLIIAFSIFNSFSRRT